MSLIDQYQKSLEEAMESEAQAVANGGASSYDDYKHRVGTLRGMRKALRIFEDTIKEIQERDEEF
jgi:hypothetical protein